MGKKTMNNYKLGESLARRYLRRQGYNVIDRRNDSRYWNKDIDFTAVKDGIVQHIEVKWIQGVDKYKCFIFELSNKDLYKTVDGWSIYTKADLIYYGDSVNKLFYVFKAEDMKAFIRLYKRNYKTKIINDYNSKGILTKQGSVLIVPIQDFKQRYEVTVIDVNKLYLLM